MKNKKMNLLLTPDRFAIPEESMSSANVKVDEVAPWLPVDNDQGLAGGQIWAANDARFTETYFSEPLTNYAVGWRDPNNIEDLLNFLAPPVPVGRRFEYKSAINAEEFLSESDDVRAIGGDFKRVEYTAKDNLGKTLNKGLTYIVDLDQVLSPQWQNQKTAKLLRRLWRNETRRAMGLLAAGSTSVGYTWDTSLHDPDSDVATEITNATDISGVPKNRVLYGETANLKRRKTYGAQNNPAGYAARAMSLQERATDLGVDEVRVSRERYQSSASAKTQIVGSNVFVFQAETGVDTEDPSDVKRFYSLFSGEQGGGMVRVFFQQISSKLAAISVEHYSQIVVTNTLGLRELVIT
jgi:hypothetical protein